MSSSADSIRAVITGVGALTPLGSNATASWKNLIAGKDARAPLTLFDVEGCRCKFAAQVELPPLTGKAATRLARASRLALPAAAEALRQAGLLEKNGTAAPCIKNIPLSLSTTGGGMELGEAFVRGAHERLRLRQLARVARYQPQQQALDLREAFGLEGPTTIIANACASGANALGHALDLITAGEADCVLAGGFEALTELIFVGFDCLQALSPELCKPFDLHRTGLLLGEGAAFFVIESEAHARDRGAHILARISGYGHATDLHHLTQPAPGGAALIDAMRGAAARAGISPADIAYVNAHGTATPANDGTEATAYAEFFQEALPHVRISSTKPAVGHTLGAAGAIEALFALNTLRTGQLPPQLHCTHPIPQVAASLARAGERLENARHVLSANLGFGGSNAALIFSQP